MPEKKPTIKSILRDFWRFLLKPTREEQIYDFSVSLALKLFLALSTIRFISIVLKVEGFQPLILHFTGEALQRQEHAPDRFADLLVNSLILAPLFEELAYRWGLRFSPIRVAISAGLIAFFWLTYGGFYSTLVLGVLDEPGFYLMVGIGLVVGSTVYALFRIPILEQAIRRWWTQNFGWVFYTSSLLFGLMHVLNVGEVTATVMGLAFFITFQQITMGLFNGYVRIRYGFGQAIVQHILFNLIVIIIHFQEYMTYFQFKFPFG